MWKVCEREKYGYHSLGYVVPRPLLTPQSINCSSSQWSVESNSAEANVLLAKHSIARRRRKSVAAMSTRNKTKGDATKASMSSIVHVDPPSCPTIGPR